MMRKFKLIADDYGLGDAHDKVMRELLAQGAIDAVSVLVETCTPASAVALREVAPAGGIGLHFNMTFPAPKPGRGKLLAQSLLGQGGPAALSALTHQRALFGDLFERVPDFYDGHEHVHTFPRIRPAILRAAAQDERPVRCMVPLDPPRSLKGHVLAGLGRSMARAAARQNIASNWRFGGVLPIDDPVRAIDMLQAELDRAQVVGTNAPGPVWVMVHPGAADDPVQVPGHPPELRAMEAALLARQVPETGV